MNGTLKQTSEGWVVKWSDLHSFAQGKHWNETRVHPSQHDLPIFQVEGLEVEFDFVSSDPTKFSEYAMIQTEFTEMEKKYEQLKKGCELPVAMFTYSYIDFEGVIHPFNSINVDLRGGFDERNVEQMVDVKNKYGEFFMFFNASDEGKAFWSDNPITITPKE